MIVKTASYYPEFYCLAQDCPNTCCAHWNIPIDRETRRHYMVLDGKMGELARSVLKKNSFRNRNDRCPFLQEDGLCRMILAAEGSQRDLSFVCRTYPRKIAEFGNQTHISLSVSCPMAARLLLKCENGIQFMERTTDEPPAMNDLDPVVFKKLLSIRQDMIACVQKRDELSVCVAQMFRQLEISLQTLDLQLRFRRLVKLFSSLQYNDKDMKTSILSLKSESKLRTALAQVETVVQSHEMLFRNLLVYMLDRYIMEAVDDGAYVPRVQLCVVWCMMFFLLVCDRYASNASMDMEEIENLLVTFSRQTEHCDRNLIRLMKRAHWVL